MLFSVYGFLFLPVLTCVFFSTLHWKNKMGRARKIVEQKIFGNLFLSVLGYFSTIFYSFSENILVNAVVHIRSHWNGKTIETSNFAVKTNMKIEDYKIEKVEHAHNSKKEGERNKSIQKIINGIDYRLAGQRSTLQWQIQTLGKRR